jgi:hypothetical protein
MLDFSSCSNRPVSRGGFGEIYEGKLRDSTKVAIKTRLIQERTNLKVSQCDLMYIYGLDPDYQYWAAYGMRIAYLVEMPTP